MAPSLTVFLVVVCLCATQCHSIIYYQPEQTHIAVGENPDEMIVVWTTPDATNISEVMYGKLGKSLDNLVSGQEVKFVDGGSEKRTQYMHTVVLKNLEFNTSYSYIVGSKLGWSDLFYFKTWPKGDNWSPRIALFGDLGNENAQSLPRLQLDTLRGMYDAILHVGDFAYDMEVDNARVGDEFMRQIEPLASKLPYMTCPGNHENAYNFSNYRHRFWMPKDEGKRMYYSFTMGPIRFISLATELWFFPQYGLLPIYQQYEWLEKTLKEANKPENRAKQPWIIAFGHRPMYCSNNDHDDCTRFESLVRIGVPIIHLYGWEVLFQKYGVDVAVWAHEHSYERLWPVYNRKVMNGSRSEPYTDPQAPVHIITGSAGCKERHDGFIKDKPEWSAFRNSDYGYTRMQVFNRTHLYLEQVSDDQGGAIVDQMMLIKHKHGSYSTNPEPLTPAADPLKKLWKRWQTSLHEQKVKIDLELGDGDFL